MDDRVVLARIVAEGTDADIPQHLLQLEEIAPGIADNLQGNRLQPVEEALEQMKRSQCVCPFVQRVVIRPDPKLRICSAYWVKYLFGKIALTSGNGYARMRAPR